MEKISKRRKKKSRTIRKNIGKESIALMFIWLLAELDIYICVYGTALAEGILDNKHNAWLQSFIYSISNQ